MVGDWGRLRQLLVNLVSNATRFTERGEIVVRVEKLQIADCRWQIAKTDDNLQSAICNLQFSVSDTGIGIVADQLRLIFAPFVQADGSTTRRYGGTGLGLAISARLAELLGGRLWAESEPGRGSTFHFTAQLGLSAGAASLGQPVSLAGLRVLVVDDNTTSRRSLKTILAHWGMRPAGVASCPAALEALAQAATAGDPFPLLLLDATLPAGESQVLTRDANNLVYPEPRVVLMVPAANPRDGERRWSLSVAMRVTKPVCQSDLLDVLQALAAGTAPGAEMLDLPASSKPPALRPLRILLVEDNVYNQRVGVLTLRKRGHEVCVAANGREALDALAGRDFDLVLMDVQMPEMDGLEAVVELRRREAGTGRRLPVFALTAHAMKGDRERCLAAGMDGYLTKPLRPAHLWQTIAELLPWAVLPADGRAEGVCPRARQRTPSTQWNCWSEWAATGRRPGS